MPSLLLCLWPVWLSASRWAIHVAAATLLPRGAGKRVDDGAAIGIGVEADTAFGADTAHWRASNARPNRSGQTAMPSNRHSFSSGRMRVKTAVSGNSGSWIGSGIGGLRHLGGTPRKMYHTGTASTSKTGRCRPCGWLPRVTLDVF